MLATTLPKSTISAGQTLSTIVAAAGCVVCSSVRPGDWASVPLTVQGPTSEDQLSNLSGTCICLDDEVVLATLDSDTVTLPALRGE
jgi:hypothetical protein